MLRVMRCRDYKAKILAVLLLFVIGMAGFYYAENGTYFMSGDTSVLKENEINEDAHNVKQMSEQITEATSNMKEQREDILKFEGKNLSGYIIYDCTKVRRGICGGWSDRLSGILDTFVMAVLSGRYFKIYHDSPCSLERYFEPNKLDWKYKSDILTSRSQIYMNLMDVNSKVIWKQAYESDHFEDIFHTEVTFIRINWDLTQMFRKRKHIAKQIPWITKLHYADIYFQLFHYLFSPGQTILAAFARLRKQRRKQLLACAHARSGDNASKGKNFSAIWSFLSTLDYSKYDIFIASDTNITIEDAYKSLQGYNVLTNTGKTGNIDKVKSDCEIFETTMLDFYTLTQCDVLVLTNSGFGMVAAYVRHTSEGLYCYRDINGVFPCSTYTLEDIYEGNFLAPS